MAIDPAQIELSEEQKEMLADLAEREGRDFRVLVSEWLNEQIAAIPEGEGARGPQDLLEAFEAVGAIGCFEGPSDLSTNPKHMEGFGINASRKRSAD